jgi:hypothetical protein
MIDVQRRISRNETRESIITKPSIGSPKALRSAEKKLDMYPGLTMERNAKRNNGMTATAIENHLRPADVANSVPNCGRSDLAFTLISLS